MLVLKNGRFCIKREQKYKMFQGDCLINQSKIEKIGTNLSAELEVDLKGAVVLPAFINAHIHLGESLFANLQGKWTLSDYLSHTERFNKNLGDLKELAWQDSANFTIQQSILYGTSTICTSRGHHLIGNSPLKGFSGYPIMNSNKLKHFIEQGLKGFQQFSKECQEMGILDGIFLHSLYTNDKSSIELVKNCMDHGAKFLTVHVAETFDTLNKTKEYWGTGPIDVLKDYQLLGPSTILVHGGFLEERELAIIQDKQAKLVICPVSNDFLQTKCLDVQQLNGYQIDWSIGTDGLGTGLNLDLLYHAQYVKRHSKLFDDEILDRITFQAAKVLGMENRIGKIEEGYFADLIIFDVPDFIDERQILNYLFTTTNELKRSVYLNGQLINLMKTKGIDEIYLKGGRV
jgi:5-methylthioadenosine/S-adenosylhomocysteine deaminase